MLSDGSHMGAGGPLALVQRGIEDDVCEPVAGDALLEEWTHERGMNLFEEFTRK